MTTADNTPTEDLGTDGERQIAIRRAVASWRDQLVDLSGRNTLLHFKDLRVGTLDLGTAEVDVVALSSLLAGHHVRLSNLFDSLELPNAAKRCRALKAKASENFEERGLRTLMVGWGMAKWTNPNSGATPAAPVLLSELSLFARGGAAEDFDLALSSDWELNPTLVHWLSAEHGVAVTSDEVGVGDFEGADPTPVFERIVKAARVNVADFSIEGRKVVGNFSYAKLPMVVDLAAAETNGLLAANSLIAAIAGDSDARAAVREAQIPGDLKEPDLTPPSDEFLVLDADASQSYVINAVVRGSHLVIEGPPGTGKSQTIANLIATLAARRQRVLFVAEKRAAIDAVVDRLQSVGLSDLVLDLHGGAGSRKQLAATLAAALHNVGAVPEPKLAAQHEELLARRSALVEREKALHAVRDPWGVTLYEAQAELFGFDSDCRLRFPQEVLARLSDQAYRQLAEWLREFVELGGLALASGRLPYSGAFLAGTITTPEAAHRLYELLVWLQQQALDDLERRLDFTCSSCGINPPPTLDGWGERLALIAAVRDAVAAAGPDVFAAPLDDWFTALQPDSGGAVGRVAARMFSGAYRKAHKSATELVGRNTEPHELFNLVSAARDQRDAWSSIATDGGIPRAPVDLDATQQAWSTTTTTLDQVRQLLGQQLRTGSIDQLREDLRALTAAQPTLLRIPRLIELHSALVNAGAQPVLDNLIARQADVDEAARTLRQMWLRSIVEVVSFSDRQIGGFDGEVHQRCVADFQAADRRHIASAPHRVKRAVAEWVTETRNAHPDQSDVIEKQAKLKRKHVPVRELFARAPDVLGALKPCWAMSPLVVSQLLPAAECFDVVIFDEASQVTPADAVGAIMRARRAVVAGDPKQLPPTSFFDPSTSDADEDEDEDDEALVSGMESILDVMGALLPPPHGTRTLGWHYRSRDERLIAFSNAQPALYDWSLTTFPGTAVDGCLSHHLVSGPSTGGTSDAEVAQVVELVLEHFERHPDESLGIIAMGIKHADRISEALRRIRADDSEMNEWLDHGPPGRTKPEPLFVKNLERVQGDERDAIILTVGYGKTSDGRMQYRFGPINNEGGHRRLNVAITRARSRMTVVSSFAAVDMDPGRLNSEGAQMLCRYLTYVGSGGENLGSSAKPKPELNPFERDVASQLTGAGIPVVAQYGVSGFWIDFAAQHPEHPGQMVLAIEADGATYHSSATARDRDRLRQEHLERLGWTFCRIWSTDWFRDREGQVARVRAAYDQAVAAADSEGAPVPPRDGRSTGDGGPGFSSGEGQLEAQVHSRGPRPTILPPGTPIGSYSSSQLVAVVRWIESDTLLRTDDELLDETIRVLGYRRRGSKIVAAIEAAIAQAHRIR